MRALCNTLGITHPHMSVYHLQTSGLVECLNGTIKCMICQCTQCDLHKWDMLLTPLLFLIWDPPEELAQFSLIQMAMCLEA